MSDSIDEFSFIRFSPKPAVKLPFQPVAMNFEYPPADPVAEIRRWLEEAFQLALPNPNAMYVATVNADGSPSLRTVLLRGFDEHGAVFFTNRLSRKGLELTARPKAALLLHWDQLDRQIRIEGSVTSTTEQHSDAYFSQRPRGNQIGAWASEQSRPLPHRAVFDQRVGEFEKRFAEKDVARPPHWGGYRVALESIEFWQGHSERLHDRVVYTKSSSGFGSGSGSSSGSPAGSGSRWNIGRLFP